MKFNIKLTEPLRFSDEEFFTLCANNPELRLEKDKYGNIILTSPTGINTSFLNGILVTGNYGKLKKLMIQRVNSACQKNKIWF